MSILFDSEVDLLMHQIQTIRIDTAKDRRLNWAFNFDWLYFSLQQEIHRRKQEGSAPGELVEIPTKYKGLVMGKGGDNLRNISTQTGAKVIRKEGEVFIVSGTEEQRQQARVNIKIIIVSKSISLLYVLLN